ncbi:MAG: helix-turn-helix domain-containing protein [Cryomorphaceae bacterium]
MKRELKSLENALDGFLQQLTLEGMTISDKTLENCEEYFEERGPRRANSLQMDRFLFKLELVRTTLISGVKPNLKSHAFQNRQYQDAEPTLTIEEVCNLYRVSDSTMRGWISKEKLIRANRVNPARYFKSDIEIMMATKGYGTPPE